MFNYVIYRIRGLDVDEIDEFMLYLALDGKLPLDT